MAELTPIIKDSFLQFAGAVLQSRALPDVRDCMKPSARQIFYCLYTDKFVHNKPFQKTLKAIGSAFRMYIHGDSSAEGIIMRAGQPFSMRYPLIEVEGSYGTLIASSSWAAPRYTASRLSPLAEYLFSDIDKKVVDEWRWNYDDTEQFPMVLPSKGFFNLVNGAYGIGVGASASIPQYNLKELNEALIKLLWNPDIDFEEIYCIPDFATGAILLNADAVKESHRNGNGFACKLRSVVEYSDKDRCFTVTEIPYMTYTETICRELEEIINSEENPGIERFNDLTGETPLIKIYLTKVAKPDKVLNYLYKNTALQSHYGVNFTMLEQGRYPRTFTWKEILQAHIDHETKIYINGFCFDLNKIKARLHIIEGLLKAIDAIDEVIKTIKEAADTKNASRGLQLLLHIDENQAKAILEIKLSRLAHLEVNKLVNEQKELTAEKNRIETILKDESLLKKEIENGLREVAKRFGDDRRTKVLNLQMTEEEEVIEEKKLTISLTNFANLYIGESSTLIAQRRGGVGSKLKLHEGEYVINTLVDSNQGTLMLFSNKGKFYNYPLTKFIPNTVVNLHDIIITEDNEQITSITSYANIKNTPYIIFTTKQGLVKKSLLEDYQVKKASGAIGIKLKENDEIISISFMNIEQLGILTKTGNFVIINTEDMRVVGKIASGVKGVALSSNDEVVAAHPINKEKELLTITVKGQSSRTSVTDFHITGRGTKGVKVQKINENDFMCDFVVTSNINEEVLIFSKKSSLKIPINSVPLTARGAAGVKGIKIKDDDKVVRIELNKS